MICISYQRGFKSLQLSAHDFPIDKMPVLGFEGYPTEKLRTCVLD